MARENELGIECRVRRILFMRRHKWPIRIAGLLVGGAIPTVLFPLLVLLIDRMLRGTASLGNLPSLLFLFAPMSVVLIIPGAALGFFIARNTTSQRIPYGFCPFCGYNLQNYTVPRCPECGNATVSEY